MSRAMTSVERATALTGCVTFKSLQSESYANHCTSVALLRSLLQRKSNYNTSTGLVHFNCSKELSFMRVALIILFSARVHTM